MDQRTLFLTLSSQFLIQAAISRALSIRARIANFDDQLEDGWDNLDEEDLDNPVLLTPVASEQLIQISTDAIAIMNYIQSEATSPSLDRTRGLYNQIPKCMEYFEISLAWPDVMFRHEYRISRPTFDKLVGVLEKNKIFKSTGRKPQRAVRYQLAVFLMRYGGPSSCDALSVAKRMGIGLGTVWLYSRRVTRALRELGLYLITWGSPERRRETATFIEERSGFPNCIGIIDGSLIRLSETPLESGVVYFCRKKFPSINVQAVVDHERRFISIDLGWPGSLNDVTILKNSRLWKNRATLFAGDQYLFADRGYQSSPYLLRPFTEPEVDEHEGAERSRRLAFNKTLSGTRIYVEHAFGLLKGRFGCLKCFGAVEDIDDVYKVTQALMTVHNFCIDNNDAPHEFQEDGILIDALDNAGNGVGDAEVEGYGGGDLPNNEVVPEYETDDWHREEGYAKRNSMLDMLFPVEEYS